MKKKDLSREKLLSMMAGGEELINLKLSLKEIDRTSKKIMQIGIDLGATKIEYVLLDNNNKELERNRVSDTKKFSRYDNILIKIRQKFRKNINQILLLEFVILVI